MCKIEYIYKTGETEIVNSSNTTLQEYQLLKKHIHVKLEFTAKYDEGYILVIDLDGLYMKQKVYYDNQFLIWLAIMKADEIPTII